MCALRLWLLMFSVLLSACTTTQQPVLGESITFKPGWGALKQSVGEAIADPQVWGSLLGAVVLQVAVMDQELSEQLREHTPLFGSSDRANERSDDFRSLTSAAYISTALLVPGSQESGPWLSSKARLLGSEWLAVESTSVVTTGLKDSTKRQRPNGRDDESLPSGHASGATIRAQMANLNVGYLPIPATTRRNLKLTFDGFAVLTAWARVEAGLHYPSDVLAGWALGHFMAHFANDFIIPDQQQIQLYPQVVSDGFAMQLVTRF